LSFISSLKADSIYFFIISIFCKKNNLYRRSQLFCRSNIEAPGKPSFVKLFIRALNSCSMEFEDRIPKLIANWLRRALTIEEEQVLYHWINESESNKRFFIKATDGRVLAEELKHFNRGDITQRLDKILESIHSESRIAGIKEFVIIGNNGWCTC
jgi:hypothetical protein